MKKILTFALVALIFSCSSDESETPQINNNAPVGKLIKSETVFQTPSGNQTVTNIYNYDSLGRISEITDASFSTLISYLYNDEGQIFKENFSNGESREYQYENGLITLVIFLNTDRITELMYDSNLKLIKCTNFNGDVFHSEKDFTNDDNGNVLSIDDGNSIVLYEYDNMNNPLNNAFENQEFNKTFRIFPLLPPTQTPNNITSKSGGFNSTLTHTYNTAGFPITTSETTQDGIVREVTYTYQE